MSEIKLILGDCLEEMKTIPDKSIDLVLTDPPYGVRKKEAWDDKNNFIKQVDNWLNECLRISEVVVWFCAGKMMPYVLRDREDVFHRLLIWNKPAGSQFAGAMHNNIWYSLEPILIFGDPRGRGGEAQFDYACWDARTQPFKQTLHPRPLYGFRYYWGRL